MIILRLRTVLRHVDTLWARHSQNYRQTLIRIGKLFSNFALPLTSYSRIIITLGATQGNCHLFSKKVCVTFYQMCNKGWILTIIISLCWAPILCDTNILLLFIMIHLCTDRRNLRLFDGVAWNLFLYGDLLDHNFVFFRLVLLN